MRLTVFVLAGTAALSAPLPGQAASFDCSKAANATEHAVCGDPRLSEMDTLLGRAFAQAKKASAADKEDAARTMAIAKVFIAQQKICGAARACLVAAYAGAIEGYTTVGSKIAIPAWVDARVIADGDAPASGKVPAKPGQCVATQVEGVGPRLEGDGPPKPQDFDSGTSIDFANGGHQVSYDREPALIASRRGDKVTMCLIAIPQNCPPGDDRGRSYLVTNQRTKQTWTLTDSQHMCGGA